MRLLPPCLSTGHRFAELSQKKAPTHKAPGLFLFTVGMDSDLLGRYCGRLVLALLPTATAIFFAHAPA